MTGLTADYIEEGQAWLDHHKALVDSLVWVYYFNGRLA